MVIVQFSGGLGNQLFQYTLVEYLKLFGEKVFVDVLSSYKYNIEHNGPEFHKIFNINDCPELRYELFFFSIRRKCIIFLLHFLRKIIHSNRITEWKISHLFPFWFLPSFLFTTINIDNSTVVFKEDCLYINSRCIHFKKKQFQKYILSGCASINPEWMIDIESKLRNLCIRYDKHLNNENDSILKKIENSNSVGVHIRRGDFGKSKGREKSIILNPAYYIEAFNRIEMELINPEYYIFTDDKEWVRSCFNLSNAFIVDVNGIDKCFLDMFLMSRCKHNIISNSTFSWWGAWLNANPSKIVISPKHLYGCDPMLVAKGWVIL